MQVALSDVPSSTAALERRMVAHDLWPRRLIERRERRAPQLPARVFWPRNTADVQAVLNEAAKDHIPVVPFGAGSGVSGGISPSSATWVLDLKRMNRVLHIDEERGLVEVEAGIIGERLERALNTQGLTLGHFPSSIYCSTVGGWVATRSAGQLSTRFGKIEDLVVALEAVDGTGRRLRARLDDTATGPGALRCLVGSEGTLATITQVTLRVRPLASHRWLRGYAFDRLDNGIESLRFVMQSGAAPAVLRLYDPTDGLLSGALEDKSGEPHRIEEGPIASAGQEWSGPEGDEPTVVDRLTDHLDRFALFSRPKATRALVGETLASPLLVNSTLERLSGSSKLVVGYEGGHDDVKKHCESIHAGLLAHGGRDAGTAPGARWLLHRHRVSYRMSRVFAAGAWVDTMEVATSWDDVYDLYLAVKEALRDVALVMCHFSHAYVDGCSLYFTFAGGGRAKGGARSALSRYDLAWERALACVRQRGAVLSHHHGIGRSKARARRPSSGESALLAALKHSFDPHGIMNPGALGLGESASSSALGGRS